MNKLRKTFEKLVVLFLVITIMFTGTTASAEYNGSRDYASDAHIAIKNFPGGLGSEYVPPLVDTGRVSLDGECYLTTETWDAYQAMEAAAAAEGISIGINSCYRSFEQQKSVTGNSPAQAGYSEHQLGSTIDIANHDRGRINIAQVNEWLYAHSEQFGFINRFWNMSNEKHHFRFVGTQLAQAYAKYKTTTSGRPKYSITYDQFVNTPEAQALFATRDNPTPAPEVTPTPEPSVEPTPSEDNTNSEETVIPDLKEEDESTENKSNTNDKSNNKNNNTIEDNTNTNDKFNNESNNTIEDNTKAKSRIYKNANNETIQSITVEVPDTIAHSSTTILGILLLIGGSSIILFTKKENSD